MDTYKRYITVQVRAEWDTPSDQFNDEDNEQVLSEVIDRIERCLRINVCGQVGDVPGTAKMQLSFCSVI